MAVVYMDCATTSSQAIIELIELVEGWQFVLKIMIIAKKENKTCYLTGDYDINIHNYASHAQTAHFVDMMSSNGVLPFNIHFKQWTHQ